MGIGPVAMTPRLATLGEPEKSGHKPNKGNPTKNTYVFATLVFLVALASTLVSQHRLLPHSATHRNTSSTSLDLFLFSPLPFYPPPLLPLRANYTKQNKPNKQQTTPTTTHTTTFSSTFYICDQVQHILRQRRNNITHQKLHAKTRSERIYSWRLVRRRRRLLRRHSGSLRLLLIRAGVEPHPGPTAASRPSALPKSNIRLEEALGPVGQLDDPSTLVNVGSSCFIGDYICAWVRLQHEESWFTCSFKVQHLATPANADSLWVSCNDPRLLHIFSSDNLPQVVPFPVVGLFFSRSTRFRPPHEDTSSSSSPEEKPTTQKRAKNAPAKKKKQTHPTQPADTTEITRFGTLMANSIFEGKLNSTFGFTNIHGNMCALNSALGVLRCFKPACFNFKSQEAADNFRNEASTLCKFQPSPRADLGAVLRTLITNAKLPNITLPIEGNDILSWSLSTDFPTIIELSVRMPVASVLSSLDEPPLGIIFHRESPRHFMFALRNSSGTGWHIIDDSKSTEIAHLDDSQASGWAPCVLVLPSAKKPTIFTLNVSEFSQASQHILPQVEATLAGVSSPPRRSAKKKQHVHFEKSVFARPADQPTLRKVPEHMIPELQLSVGTILRHLPTANVAECDELFQDFLRFPSRALPAIAGTTRYRNKVVRAALASTRQELNGDSPSQSPTTEKNSITKDVMQQHNNKAQSAAVRLARQGYLSRAVRRLLNSPTGEMDPEEVETKLRNLHPTGTPVDVNVESGSPFIVTPEMIVENLKRLAGGKSPGPSGWTEELLLQVAGDQDNAIGLAVLVQKIIDGQSVNSANLVTDAVIIGLPKPDGGIRPIAMGETILRLAGTILVAKNLKILRAHFADTQFALEEGGAEKIIHQCRKRIREDKQSVIITLDCKNAFNSLTRSSILEQLTGIFSPMRGYFQFAYGSTSRLLFRKFEKWSILSSSCGGKQGDTAMPAFFSLAMHPVIRDIASKYNVSCFAYLDDITIVGRADHAVKAAQEIERRLASIGLYLNKSKCDVFGCGAQSVAHSLGFNALPNGIKVLGAWITTIENSDATHSFLTKQLQKHMAMLESVQHLPPDIALPLLTFCGIPRWNFIVRTHPPEESARSTSLFDEAVLQTFNKIINTNNLSPSQLSLLHLPTARGGLGITSYSLIAAGAYAASLDEKSDCQEVRTSLLNDELDLKLRADKSIAAHLDLCKQRHASSWICATDVICSDQQGFQAAVQLRLRYRPATEKTLVKCICGFTASPSDIELHAPGCHGGKHNHLTERHSTTQTELSNIARSVGVKCVLEPQLNGKKRADAELHLLTGPLLVDFTICNESAPSYINKSPHQLQTEKNTKKQKHYLDGLQGRTLKTFYLAALGGWSNDAISVVTNLVSGTTVTKQSAIRRISKSTMCQTGRMILQTRKHYISESPENHLRSPTNTIPRSKSTTKKPQVSVSSTPLQVDPRRSLFQDDVIPNVSESCVAENLDTNLLSFLGQDDGIPNCESSASVTNFRRSPHTDDVCFSVRQTPSGCDPICESAADRDSDELRNMM